MYRNKGLVSSFSKLVLKLFGWRVEGELPDIEKYIIVGAPHTSNWDFIIMLAISLIYRQKFYWMGKHTLFRWPFDNLFRRLGGIPINRESKSNTVSQVIHYFKTQENLAMIITPEGTRKKVTYWRSGFYYIAMGANIPILLGFVDYKRKVAGIGPLIKPSGNIESDMKIIRIFYANISGKYPDKAGDIRVRS